MSALIPLLTIVALAAPPEPKPADAPDLGRVNFAQRFKGFEGCFVLHPVGGEWTMRYQDARCAKRHSPCSTFKIFNALAGLDCGVLADGNTQYKWDGKPQSRPELERDHTLASAIKVSVVWYFQKVAEQIGSKRMAAYLAAADYGNKDMSGGLTIFWLNSTLKISADEQVHFLDKLYGGKLPFSGRAVETLKPLLVIKRGPGWVFAGKTGSWDSSPATNEKNGAKRNDKNWLGWFVGCVESDGKKYVFAANIRGATGRALDAAGGPTCRDIVFNILGDLGLVTE